LFRLSLGIAFFIGISTPTGLWAVTDYRLSVTGLAISVPVAYFLGEQGAIWPAEIRIEFWTA
jgi:hypothetical protein